LQHPRLSVADQHRLVDAFLAVACVRDRRVRDLIVNSLADDPGRRLAIVRQDIERADMLAIVGACARHPGALRELASIVEFFESGSIALEQLRSMVDRLDPEPLIASYQRADLDALLAEITCPDAEHLYWLAVGPLGPPPTQSPGTLLSLARDLEDAVVAEELPPLLIFVELVAGQSPAHASALRAWTDGYAIQWEIDPARIAQLRASALERSSDRHARSYLVVQLEPFGPNQEQYLLSAWFQRGRLSHVLRRGEEPHDIDDVPQEIDHLLTQDAEVTRDAAAELTIEVILPRQLIDREVDQWLVAPVGFPRPLGTQHPVVIRSLERLQAFALHRQWRRKWDWFKEHASSPDITDGRLHWITVAGMTDPQQLMIQLMAGTWPVCAVMAFPPPPGRVLGRDEFAAAVHAGIPVMVWCRDRRDAAAFEKEIRQLVGDHGLLKLPELVHRYRQQAHYPNQPTSHLGRHLTLLWDDADRFPERFDNLAPPARGLR
jgi:vWA-MoxR associated protein C-terminal domain/Effector-associated domain 2/vWA-MoxR associated protein middle region 0